MEAKAIVNKEELGHTVKDGYRWKVIIPMIFVMYLLAYIDRTNISFALTEMQKTFAITSTVSGFIAGIFFCGYILLMAPMGHLASRKSARKIVVILGVLTGIFSSIQGMVNSVGMLVFVRFLLGLVEGGIYPAMGVLIANWFPKNERGRATSIFYLYVTVAPLIMSPISGYIVSNVHWFGLDSWRWVFITQGVPVLLFSLLFFYLIPDHPLKASKKRISNQERTYLLEQQAIEASEPKVIQEKSYWKAALNRNFILVSLAYFMAGGIGNYGIIIWLPVIIKEFSTFGYTAVGFISAIPWLIGTIGMVSIGFINDKFGNKRVLLFILNVIAGISLLSAILVLESNLWVAIFLISITIVGGMSSSAVFMTLIADVFPANMIGGMTGLWNAIGNMGGFVGPFVVGALMAGDNKLVGVGFLSVCYIIGSIIVLFVKLRKEKAS
ncbi:MFS transporter [Aneurinibacillus aneurinilyticus]|jgi:MFS family permease|uniref:Transporter, major facilitator family protein n=1 Tax=Aneurinibacillus aneurinilyticus ATCC 12856 TaxID=649747 RepID=U1X4E4_ANEAE|nr:MFS transporter [Aneurinibacillus aneurinilyticus]ERI09408.1 transporter, major facilitator family protein [Aneurinibacillus aneurinilyticus ATCC 12856]MCI1696053.1 MFS transporter [Aneurinibacillus aneurinilyticus]MED0707616.1 MFS transporter [Aneurinibacillus aneurinilyticus]MED0722840.1 MFS transporter [Aneurinibacillus aneurinilyticus]MED0731233.1 MFS transporter [Aneurinibacillus aneurinilyticus]